jgi:hypothetical protein
VKHSPAPWSLRARKSRLPGDSEEGIVALDILSRGRLIGSVTIRADLPAKANAALMAAAPELLAFVRDVAEWICAEVVPGRPGCGECPPCLARALVARILTVEPTRKEA